MNPLRLLLFGALLLPGPLAFASDDGAHKPKRTLLNHLLHPFSKSSTPAAPPSGKPGWRQLALVMNLDPVALKLGENRTVKVSVVLTNKSKKFVQLEFPTTQRIEVVVRTTAGKLVEQWSEDRDFTDQAGLISINPGERLEYDANLSTRDMVAGQPYIIEAFFPRYEQLRVQRSIVPEK